MPIKLSDASLLSRKHQRGDTGPGLHRRQKEKMEKMWPCLEPTGANGNNRCVRHNRHICSSRCFSNCFCFAMTLPPYCDHINGSQWSEAALMNGVAVWFNAPPFSTNNLIQCIFPLDLMKVVVLNVTNSTTSSNMALVFSGKHVVVKVPHLPGIGIWMRWRVHATTCGCEIGLSLSGKGTWLFHLGVSYFNTAGREPIALLTTVFRTTLELVHVVCWPDAAPPPTSGSPFNATTSPHKEERRKGGRENKT